MKSKANLLTRFLIWRKHHINDNQFLNILSVVVGFMAGLGAVVIKKAVHFLQDLLTRGFVPEYQNLNFVLYPVIGIFIVVILIKFVLKRPVGHGIPIVLYALGKNNGIIKPYQMWASVVTSTLTVGFGGSVGLEGPTVATGGAIGSNLARLLNLDFKRVILLIGCASAGAMSAIFKAPITGVLFAIEVMMLDLTLTALVPLLVASATATLVSYAFLGQMFLYDFEMQHAFTIDEVPIYVLFGVLTGFVSVYFTQIFHFMDGMFDRMKGWATKYIVGSLILGILIFLIPSFYGEGYEAINACLHGDYSYLFNHTIYFDLKESETVMAVLFLAIILLKVVATQATFGSGGIGGVFAPSMFIGANTGLLFSSISSSLGYTGIAPSNMALVGMAGIVAGNIHAPLTAMFLIAEITGGYMLFMPLMIVATISYGTVHFFEKNSIYTAQLAKSGDLFTHDKDKVVLSLMKVPNLLETNFQTIHKDATLRELVDVIKKSKRNVFPVIDEENNFYGTVHLNDIRHVIFQPDLYDSTNVTSLMNAPLASCSPDDSMEEVVNKFQKTNHFNIPVLDSGKYVGFVSRANVLSKYRKLLKHFSED